MTEFRTTNVAPFLALLLMLFAAPGADAGRAKGIPKSAPAFTKFVARFIEEALPSAKVNIAGRLMLVANMPNGEHDTDLHNIYSVCQRDPDNCPQNLTVFVADIVYGYKATNNGPSRASLRIVVRPSGYIAALRADPRRKPIAVPLAGDWWVMAVNDRPTSIAMLDESDLKGLNLSPKEAMTLATRNTREALQNSLKKELATGSCRGILGGDIYTASTVAFADLWAPLAKRCHGKVLIAIPATDAVLYVDGSEPGARESLMRVASQIAAKEEKPFPPQAFRWTDKGWAAVAK